MKFCENCGAENEDNRKECIKCRYDFKENEENNKNKEESYKYIYKLPIKYCGNILEKILIILHIKKRPFIGCDSLEKYFQIMEIYEGK